MQKITNFIKNFIARIFNINNNDNSLLIKKDSTIPTKAITDVEATALVESELHIKVKKHLKTLVALQQYEEIKELLSIYPELSPSIIEPLNDHLVDILTDDSYSKRLGVYINNYSANEIDEDLVKKTSQILDIVDTNVEFRKYFFIKFNKDMSERKSFGNKSFINYSIFSTSASFFLTFDENNNIVTNNLECRPYFIKKFQQLCFNALDDYFNGNTQTAPYLNSSIIYSYLRNNPQLLHSEKMLVEKKDYFHNSWFYITLSPQEDKKTLISNQESEIFSNIVLNQLTSKQFENIQFNNDTIKEEHFNIINQIKKEKLKNLSQTCDIKSLHAFLPNLDLSLKSEIILNNIISNVQKMKNQNLNVEENHHLKNIEDSIFEYFSNYAQISEILNKEELELHSTEYITNINKSFEDLINNISTNKIDSLKRNLKISKTIR